MLVSTEFLSSCPSSHRSECTPFTCLIITGTGEKTTGIVWHPDTGSWTIRKNWWGKGIQWVSWKALWVESVVPRRKEEEEKVDSRHQSFGGREKTGGRETSLWEKIELLARKHSSGFDIMSFVKQSLHSPLRISPSPGFTRWHFDPKAVKLNFLPTGQGERSGVKGLPFLTFTEIHCPYKSPFKIMRSRYTSEKRTVVRRHGATFFFAEQKS